MTAPAPRAATPEDDGQTHWDIAEVGTVCHDECAVAQLRQKRAAPPEPDAWDVAKTKLLTPEFAANWLREQHKLRQTYQLKPIADLIESLAAALAGKEREAERLRGDLATFASLARRMMDMHPGCAHSACAATLPGKFCPECGWHHRAAIDAAKDDANRS